MKKKGLYNMQMRSCEDIDFPATPTESDVNCLQILAEYAKATFLERWVFGTEKVVIGAGSRGIALKVYHKTDRTIPLLIKIMPRRDAEDAKRAEIEIKTACDVDMILAQKMRTYSRTYGWIPCHGSQMPVTWKTEIQKHGIKAFDPLNDPCYFIVGEYANGVDLTRYSFKLVEEVKPFLFEIVYALYYGYQNYSYFHHDLHMGNVIASVNAAEGRVYSMDDETTFLIESDVRPVIIDYGLSTFSIVESAYEWGTHFLDYNHPLPNRMVDLYLEWLFGHHEEFRHHVLRDVDKLLMSMEMKSPSSEEVITWIRNLRSALPSYDFVSLLRSEWFSSLKSIRPAGAAIRECHSCGSNASFEYEHAPSFAFCDKACAAHMGPIGKLVN